MDKNRAVEKYAETFFENLWRQGDPWEFETSAYDQNSYKRQAGLLSDRRYQCALEIGCGSGSFTHYLVGFTDRLVAVDIAPTAIRAAQRAEIRGEVEFRTANIMNSEIEREAKWDLIVLNETIYYLGWLYPFFDIYWLAHRLFEASQAGGRLLMVNTCGGARDYLQRTDIIRSYRDLFVNVGYRIEQELVFRGVKNNIELEALMTLFTTPKGRDRITT